MEKALKQPPNFWFEIRAEFDYCTTTATQADEILHILIRKFRGHIIAIDWVTGDDIKVEFRSMMYYHVDRPKAWVIMVSKKYLVPSFITEDQTN